MSHPLSRPDSSHPVAFSVYCKSYRNDLKRTFRLAQSIDKFNVDTIPFYVSAPRADIPLFQDFLGNTSAVLVEDEDIIGKNPKIDLDRLQSLHGGLTQQIVKSEFWRMNFSSNYLCLDADSFFIRPFATDYFLSSEGTAYTVIDEAHELLDAALSMNKLAVIDNFQRETRLFKEIFERKGRDYSFGPNPVIWSNAVWRSLEANFLDPLGISFLEAVLRAPIDANWYGEALLKFKAIPMLPCQPLFKVYHYAWQLDRDIKSKVGEKELARLYAGVIYQSAWDREMDWPSEPGKWRSKLARRLRRGLGRM